VEHLYVRGSVHFLLRLMQLFAACLLQSFFAIGLWHITFSITGIIYYVVLIYIIRKK